jgi:hypothetical protein
MNGLCPKGLDIKEAFLYGELKFILYMLLREGYRDSNNFAHLNRCIDRLQVLSRE